MNRIGFCALLGAAIFCGFGTVRAEEPNLHFGFLTDTHVLDDDASYDCVRLALALFREKGVSLIAHGGDVSTHNVVERYQKYKSIFDETFAGATPPVQLTAVGNHDSFWKVGGTDQTASVQLENSVRMLETLGVANTHTDKKVIGGYTFLIMPWAIGKTGFIGWTEYESLISEACRENPGRPVFLLEHEPPQDTIYNSHDWGSSKKRTILDRYPQIIELSGHVHGSLRNDQYIWQGAFSILNGGCLTTWNGLLNGASASDPKPAYEVLTVDVFDDRLVAHRWNIHDKTEINPENPWTIPLPFAAMTAPYNREELVANEVPAAFPAAAEVSVSSDDANVTVSFPETSGNVMTYMITVKDGASTVSAREIFADYWREPSARTGTASLAFPLSGFAPQRDYTFEVQPVGQYGKKGEAISQDWRSVSLVDTPDHFVEYVESDGSTFVDTEVIGKSGTKAEIDMLFPSSGGTAELGANCAILGARKDSGETRFFLFHTSNPSGSKALFTYGYGTYTWTDSPLAAGVRYQMESTLEAKKQVLCLNGNTVVQETSKTSIDTGKNLYLFACNYQSKAQYPLKARCYSLKIWQTDANGDYRLVRNFRPCVKDGVAGLYDYVSGKIFYGHSTSSLTTLRNLKAPTGAFDTLIVKGKPDRFVEFVSSDGQQIIDTGLPARSGLKAWADMKWLGDRVPASGSEFSLLSAQNKSNVGVYLIHDSYNKNNALDGGKVNRVRFICGTGFWPMHEDGKSYIWDFHTDPRDNPRITVEGDFTDPANITYSINGESIPVDGAGMTVDTGLNLTMFGANFSDQSWYKSKVRLYGLKLWLDGKLARDFSPCLKDGKAGLYDAVNDEILFPAVPFPLSGVGMTEFVDYVESDGSNYVNTEVRGKSSVKMVTDLMYLQLDKNNGFMGSRYKSSTSNRFFPFHCNNEYVSLGYKEFRQSGMTVSTGVKYHVDSTLEPGNQKLLVDGVEASTVQVAGAVDSERDMYLFGANIGGTADYLQKIRCYGLKLWQTDENGEYQLMRDFHPCVTYMLSGETDCGLYDAVSGRIFHSAAGSPLLFGNDADSVKGRPDKYVEYIQVSGFQTFDTGVPARTGVKAEGGFAFWSDLGEEQCYLGSQKDDCLRMINLKTDPTNPALTPQFWSAFGNAAVGAGYLEYPDGSRAQCEKGVKYHFVCDWTDPAHATLDLNGQRVMNAANDSAPSSGDTLGLFACRTGTGYLYQSCTRCYGLKLWLDGELVRDFVPCVKDGRGALFDRITRRCYFPQGVDITEDNVGPQVPGPGFKVIVR